MSYVSEGPSRTNAGDPAPLEFMTVYVKTAPVDPALILPYVLDVIQAIGCGSAVAIGNKGLQLTVPAQLTQSLQATIAQYVAVDKAGVATFGLPEFVSPVFYPPVIKVVGTCASLKPHINALGICPPDITIEWLRLGEGEGALLVSGPAPRLDYYRTNIFPSLKLLANGLGPNPPRIGK